MKKKDCHKFDAGPGSKEGVPPEEAHPSPIHTFTIKMSFTAPSNPSCFGLSFGSMNYWLFMSVTVELSGDGGDFAEYSIANRAINGKTAIEKKILRSWAEFHMDEEGVPEGPFYRYILDAAIDYKVVRTALREWWAKYMCAKCEAYKKGDDCSCGKAKEVAIETIRATWAVRGPIKIEECSYPQCVMCDSGRGCPIQGHTCLCETGTIMAQHYLDKEAAAEGDEKAADRVARATAGK